LTLAHFLAIALAIEGALRGPQSRGAFMIKASIDHNQLIAKSKQNRKGARNNRDMVKIL
jgi:hypothetical protein